MASLSIIDFPSNIGAVQNASTLNLVPASHP